MNSQLLENIESIIGKIKMINKLDEQGCTSIVRQINTTSGIYLLKSSFEYKYREWLKDEATVLEKLNYTQLIPVPHYYGFIEYENSSHLIMSFEKGITLTSALKKAKTLAEKKTLIQSFGLFLQQLHETKLIESMKQENNWLDEQLKKAKSYVDNGQTEASYQLLDSLNLNKPLPVKQTVIHGDCTTDNVLVFDGQVRLFIDVAGMKVGDPRYDESLAIRDFTENEVYLKAFYEGYNRYKVSREEFQYFDEGLYEFF